MTRAGAVQSALAAAAVWLTAVPASAEPSFDCAQARLPIEQALCADAELGDLEGQMTRLYHDRLSAADPGEATRLGGEMGRWLNGLTRDCGVPRNGTLDAAGMEQVKPCLASKYRSRIAVLQAPAAPAEPAPAEPAPAALATLEAAPSAPAPGSAPQQVPQGANSLAWRALPYGEGLVAIIAREEGGQTYATASVYCDSAYRADVPVFLYRLGGLVPPAEEVARVNGLIEGVTLSVDGTAIQKRSRRDLGRTFSGLQLLGDGTLSYMLLIDSDVLEAVLHGESLQAVLDLPPDANADPRYTGQTFPLKNSRKAIETAMKRCV